MSGKLSPGLPAHLKNAGEIQSIGSVSGVGRRPDRVRSRHIKVGRRDRSKRFRELEVA